MKQLSAASLVVMMALAWMPARFGQPQTFYRSAEAAARTMVVAIFHTGLAVSKDRITVATKSLVPNLLPTRGATRSVADNKAVLFLLPVGLLSIGLVLYLIIDACVVWRRNRKHLKWMIKVAQKQTHRSHL